MRITFVLPTPIRIPMGGAKVVYEHARGLAARGHVVKVVAPKQETRSPIALARRAAVAVRDRIHGVAGEHAYSASGVETIDLPNPSGASFPKADVTIATGVQTAPWVARLPPEAGRSLYFVQGDETFVRPDARESWHLGMPLITCASWLAREMEAVGLEPLAVIPNAIDPSEFSVDVPLHARPAQIIALYHRHPVKGPDVLIGALETIRRQRSDVGADVFCARPPSHALPDWVSVHVRPAPRLLRALYNGAPVLLHPSRSEGWPLVPMEAAACGCVVVASANPGVGEYLASGESMLTAGIGDGEGLGEAALNVMSNPTLRSRLSQAGQQAVANYLWRESTDRLEAVLQDLG
ncbi:glycosyltransferase family 4 protein [Rubricoccus marinus]|uniref:Glycosyl transferase family 1 domain-containing protein n=1 Tax=Rubricoccus marinus TaxID=716817 RepID=A0A259TYT9_9BACT|nr:glycosyltransferase family 4 protein [Rubricoccus marinus]OZC02787.1 hypothetical protein BSZ36_07250 [Rubricoccus marinus]